MRTHHQTLAESFGSALRGIRHALKERNFFIQVVIGCIVIAASWALQLPKDEEIIVLMIVCLVLGAEMINSAVEGALDVIEEKGNPEIARIKEILAGSVLLFSVLSVIVGALIFWEVLWG